MVDSKQPPSPKGHITTAATAPDMPGPVPSPDKSEKGVPAPETDKPVEPEKEQPTAKPTGAARLRLKKRSLVESVKTGGVNQPALVRPRAEGGYEIIAGL